jgi:hypothetical protein
MKSALLLLSLLLVGLPFAAESQQPLVGLIEGKIKNERKAPIAFASLTATNIDSVERNSDRRTTGADKQGFYQFVNVPAGRYSIVVSMRGYRAYTVPLVTVRGSQRVRMPEIKMSRGENDNCVCPYAFSAVQPPQRPYGWYSFSECSLTAER